MSGDSTVSTSGALSETACDRAPIHIPGTIQSHGRLLVLSSGAGEAGGRARVMAASANLPTAGSPMLADLLGTDAAVAVEAALSVARAGEDRVLEGLQTADGRRWTGLLRAGPVATLLEMEPEPAADPAASRQILIALNQAIAALRDQPDPAAACAVAARHLREVTGFDRVMAYRFMPDWSGAVLAESLHADTADSYLGLMFPASDIPAPARALYASNRLRLIPDAAAAPAPLHALDPGCPLPIDLGQAVLRGVAPVHLDYLANMGVRASMSVAIIVPSPDGATQQATHLWGLLACHHQQGPLFVDHVRRQAAEAIAHALSWRLAEMATLQDAKRATAMQAALAPFLDDAAGGKRAAATSPASGPLADALLDACGATGVALMGPEGADALRIGVLPPEPALRQLVSWLDRAGPGRVLMTDRLGSLLPPDLVPALGDGIACGLLAMPLSERGSDAGEGWVLWFRHELRREVVWAGHKPENPDPARALTPRASFAAWREEVAGRSAAWGDGSVAAARHFRDAAVAAVARRSARVAHANAELRRGNEVIRFFADAATHDLKEPLWQVQVLSGLIRDGLGDLLGPLPTGSPPRHPVHEALARDAAELDLETMAGLVVASAGRMRGMIDDLARLAVAGRDPDRAVPVVLRDLAEEALADLGAPLRAAPDATVLLDGLDGVVIPGDPVQLRRVFQNLFSNALKYRDRSRPLVLRAAAERVGSVVHVAVSDNGVGFDPENHQALFEPFRRFRQAGAASEEGLGLGLSICQRIVSAHGGTIEAIPLAPGARFSFLLRDPDAHLSEPALLPEEPA